MPLYTFRCNMCENLFEELCRIKNPSIVSCPTCGSEELARQMQLEGGIAVTFKNPKGTSKEDNNDYVYRWNVENAKQLRQLNEDHNKKMGQEPVTYDKYLESVKAPDYDPAHPNDVLVDGEREHV